MTVTKPDHQMPDTSLGIAPHEYVGPNVPLHWHPLLWHVCFQAKETLGRNSRVDRQIDPILCSVFFCRDRQTLARRTRSTVTHAPSVRQYLLPSKTQGQYVACPNPKQSRGGRKTGDQSVLTLTRR